MIRFGYWLPMFGGWLRNVDDEGMEYWAYDGQRHYKVGLNAVVGRPREELSFEPTRFDEMRRGAWDVDARVTDMDVNGVQRSLCFPSFLPGFVGQRLTTWPDDPELAFAAMRAYNAGKIDRKMRSWTLPFLIRHSAFHTLDHAWEMEDKDLTAAQPG